MKKPGAILIYSIVRAIMGGYLPYIILFILSGAIAELLLWKMGYGNAKALTVSYVINQVLAAFGSTIIPYALSLIHISELYADPRKHFYAFLRGVLLFLAVALINGYLLTWI